MDIISVALKRHSTKAFDPAKKLTAEEAEKSKRCCNTARPAPTPSRGTLLLPALKRVKRAWQNPRRAPMCLTNANAGCLSRGGVLRENRDGRCLA